MQKESHEADCFTCNGLNKKNALKKNMFKSQ